jgi:hypothetical protein
LLDEVVDDGARRNVDRRHHMWTKTAAEIFESLATML